MHSGWARSRGRGVQVPLHRPDDWSDCIPSLSRASPNRASEAIGGEEEETASGLWELKAREVVNRTFCSAGDLILEINKWAESKLKGTRPENYRVYHDHLKVLWDTCGITLMNSIRLYDRMLKIERRPGLKLYNNKMVGNSTELCIGLNAQRFADLESSIAFHCATTHSNVDIHRINIGNLAETDSAILRCWERKPTPDIAGQPNVL